MLLNTSLGSIKKLLEIDSYSYFKLMLNKNRNILLLLCLPIFLVWVDNSWILSYVINKKTGIYFEGITTDPIDPWIYLGYFLNLPEHLHTFSATYFGTRLPWLIPGYFIHSWFAPVTAAYVLHILFYEIAIISFYFILKMTVNQRVALLASIFMGCHYYFLQAIGENYVDGAGIAYLLFAQCMLTKGIKSDKSNVWLFFGGVFFGCAVYTNLFLIIFALSFSFYYAATKNIKVLSFIYNFTAFCVGFLALTCLLGIYNRFFHGRFLFFIPSIDYVRFAMSAGKNGWWLSLSDWFLESPWNFFSYAVFFVSMLCIILRQKLTLVAQNKFILFFQLNFIFITTLFFLLQLKGGNYLSLRFYASYLMPALFLAIGGQLALLLNNLTERRYYFLTIIIAVISILSYAPIHWMEGFSFLIVVFLGVLIGLFAIFKLRCYKEGLLLLVAALFVTFNINSIRLDMRYKSPDGAYAAITQGLEAIKVLNPTADAYFWYDFQSSVGYLGRPIASSYLHTVKWLINEEFPHLTATSFKGYNHPIELGHKIFIISDSKNVIDQANANLASMGLQADLLNTVDIQYKLNHYQITYVKITKLNKVTV